MSSLAARSRGRVSVAASWPPALGVLTFMVLLLLAGNLSPYDRDLMTTLLIYVSLAQAWNIIGGFGGQFSLAHSAFVGAGAYTMTMLLIHSNVPLAIAMLASAIVASGLAFVSAIALFRLRGVYFTVGSLAVALAAQAWMTNWSYTGGTQGLNVPFDALPSPESIYLIALGVAAIAMGSAWLIRHSRFGLRLMAVRDDEDAAAGLGVAGTRVKLLAFSVSAFVTGLAGAVFAVQQISVEPFSAFGLSWTISMVVMSIVGGLGTVAGPAIGAVVVYYGLQVQLQGYATLSSALTGALLIVVVRFAPDGLVGTFGALAATAKRAIAR